MVTEVIYQGGLRTKATHVKTGYEIITDASKEDKGKSEAFSPEDLMVASIVASILTTMGMEAKKEKINIDGTRIKATKEMVPSPKRIGRVTVKIYMPEQTYSDDEKYYLERAAYGCPVELSLHPKTKVDFEFEW